MKVGTTAQFAVQFYLSGKMQNCTAKYAVIRTCFINMWHCMISPELFDPIIPAP